ncbi:MAG: DUF2202 domain-containing protein [Planctomycetota bacterium]|jgi:hypothetical protein
MRPIAIATIALAGFTFATTDAAAQRGYGPGGPRGVNVRPPLCLVQDPASLGEAQEQALLQMRQEEKLARDVYLALFDVWEHPVFLIHRAEQRHMDAIARSIMRYDLDDPVVDDTPGVFTDPVFADLYEELTAGGAASLLDAVRVGALIEEMDIADLREALSVTTRPELRWKYENLMRGSRNHLRAFAARIDALGGTYEAQYLTQEEFDQIAGSPMEPGTGRRSGQGAPRAVGRQRSNDGICNGTGPGGRGEGAGRGWGRR